uniref:Uncharacterized protein n=1 Tax=Helicotheca tamesis TaxID=374047 RepID=A0A7S2N413_9STRA|eukprot:CAMPEP_0185733188 /NCGR_PEP_ID=MMETSP1171-20130828/18676_1 /TAXON_ID=374046 /ORGANISM="Helicotheca tamensis, Strain CCMP826" /LENGTH=418 /DNA_ID=CAMNT_0028402843 /DNA_START=81 /DNA_END=1337 /DNA_ORIENTATION=-
MKFSNISIIVACSLPFSSSASSLRQQRSLDVSEAGCPGGSEDFTFTTNECSAPAFETELAGKIDASTCSLAASTILSQMFGATSAADLTTKVIAACKAGYDNAPHFTFQNITQKGEQFNNEYFAGGTYWNYEVQTNDGDNVLKYDAQRVNLVRKHEAEETIIPLPTELQSFDPDGNCELNAAFCCWVKDRQAGDNNGNCATPYDSNCINKDPADNANLCYVDHTKGAVSSHVAGGFTIFADLQNNKANIEGSIHCHGFAWADESDATLNENNIIDESNIYKGNNLYFVSMFDHLYTRGYVKNVPGSPMCSCAENMAVVTRADCTEIDSTEKFTVNYDFASSEASISVETVDLDFNACTGANTNNDLESYYERLVNEGKASSAKFEELKKILVGDEAGRCLEAVEGFLSEKGIVENTTS